MTPSERLRTRLDQAFEIQWDPRRPTRYELLEVDGSLGLQFWAQDRSGSWHLVHSSALEVLSSDEQVDAFLASALSVFLMNHTRWPR